MLLARTTSFTHKGAVRDRNEDTVAIGTWVRSAPMTEPRQTLHGLDSPLLCLVADGMGGHAAGQEASRLAAFRLAEATPVPGDEAGVVALLHQVNREIFAAMREDPRREGMGTTVAGLLLGSDSAIWFNVGDSRINRFRNGFVRQLSIEDVPDRNILDGARSHVITQALGGARSFVKISPHVGREPLVPGWCYLLCSDGLTDHLDLGMIEKILVEHDGDEDGDESAVRTLFERAMAAGGLDNVSIVMIRIEEPGDCTSDVRVTGGRR